MSTRWGAERRSSGSEYDARWERLAATGQDPHGEANFVAGYQPRSVLDAGCGTGRVAIELARRGVDAVGVDLDADFIARAATKAPEIEWHQADLAVVDLGRRFDVIIAAGNVMIFVAPGSEGAVVANLGRHLAPGGRLITGFQVRADRLPLDRFDALAVEAGLSLLDRFASWAATPYDGGDYAVSVHAIDRHSNE